HMNKKLLPRKTTATPSHMTAIRISRQFRKAQCGVRTGIRLLTRPPPAHPPPPPAHPTPSPAHPSPPPT
ncbi:hypothetical protein BG015_011206, partial [Linnemannia schmuckeri]